MTLLYDAVEVTKPHLTKDGYLVAEAHVARTGIQLYRAGELELDGVDPEKVIRVYRPPEEVFAKDAMASYAYRPVTVDHKGTITADNWKQHASGSTGGDVIRDGERVRVPMALMDKAAIKEWEAGKRELSMGYEMRLEMTDGITPSGEQYDAIQRDLRMNHLALVARARGGSQLRLGDATLEDSSMSEQKLTTITVDGLSVETTDAGAQAIAKLTKDLEAARTTLDKAKAEHTEAITAKDKELAGKDAEIDNLKGKVLSDQDLDKKVKDRADLITRAKAIADQDYTGKAEDEIRKAAVVAKLGQGVVDGKSPEYVTARFDILADEAAQDPVRRVIRGGDIHSAGDAASKAHGAMVTDMQSAWKGKEAQS